MENDHPSPQELEPREPRVQDLVELCRELNRLGAKYVVIGGFAMRAIGYVRQTMDIDLMIASDLDNESRIYKALSKLPDNAVKELQPGELARYNVIRVADEVVVDLMVSAGGVDYQQAAKEIIWREVEEVPIPFASPQLLWRMKAITHREKDTSDLLFLRQWFESRGEKPPPLA